MNTSSPFFIVDLDKITIKSDERGKAAEEETQQRLASITGYVSAKRLEEIRKEIFYHAQVFYHPNRMIEDTPIEEAQLLLNQLEAQGRLVFLTSRPESTRKATEQVMCQHQLLTNNRQIYMKPDDWWMSTVAFKTGMVTFFQRAFQPERIVFIDDEKAIRNAVKKLEIPGCTIRVFASLADTCAPKPAKRVVR